MKLANIQTDILKKDLSRLKDKRIHYAVDKKKDLIFCTPDSIEWKRYYYHQDRQQMG